MSKLKPSNGLTIADQGKVKDLEKAVECFNKFMKWIALCIKQKNEIK